MQLISNTLCLISLWLLQLNLSTADYPGVIELVGYNNRRARTHFLPATDYGTSRSAPYAKMQADIETVKQNIEKYNKLLTLDTKNLPDSQKDMLERIVERVARLKESLDINENYAKEFTLQTASTADYSTTEISQQAVEAETEATLMLDETTMQLRTTLDELATSQLMETASANTELAQQSTDLEHAENAAPIFARTEASNSAINARTESEEIASTTFVYLADATDVDDQMVAARSNNKMSAITAIDETDTTPQLSTQAASQRTLTTSGKLTKIRATKRPNTAATKPSNPSSNPATAAANNNNNSGNNANNVPVKRIQRPSSSANNAQKPPIKQKQSIAQQQQQQQQQQHKIQQQAQQQQQLHFKPPPQPQQQQVQAQKLTQQPSQQPIIQTIQNNKLTSPAASATDKISSVTPLTVSDPLSQRITSADGSSPIITSVQTVSSQQQQQQLPVAGAYDSGLTIPPSSYNSNLAASYNNNANDLVYDANVNASAIIDSLNHAREEYFQQKVSAANNNNNSNVKDKKPTATAKPTKYHYYPHNQHIYLLPECAIQQVCNAVYVRLNYTQPLCACPSRYRDPCSASLNEDDQHTTKLVGDGKKKAITLAKTCEATTEMRECRSPKDWSLLALQNTRTGKSHYLVICRCPEYFKMEGPMAHDQPTYASVPGIRVFGMMCVKPGYSVRRPPAQPPKRYQLQKPYYRPSSTNGLMQNSYVSGSSSYSQEKDAYGRPIGGSSNSNGPSSGYQNSQDAYQIQHQANYQYLNRPESGLSSSNSNSYRPDSQAINNFPSSSIYGRNNERQGDAPIEATSESEDMNILINTSTHSSEETRTTLNDNNTLTSVATANKNTVVAPVDGENSPTVSLENQDNQNERKKRSLDNFVNVNELDDDTPEFPWDRVLEFSKTIDWN